MPRITIPLDASGVEEFNPEQPIKVLLVSGGKPLVSEHVTLSRDGHARVSLKFEEDPRGIRVIVGPYDATDDELIGLQTISIDVPLRRWQGKDELVIPAIRITPYYWFWWLRWCRTFTIHGRVHCPDGSPVPGAVVCAYDVDAWWWWWSRQQVGCATTDASGSFTLTFRWCCGWWPWWWWRLRRWELEPTLAGHILAALQREPRFPRLPLPDPQPDLAFFESLIGEEPSIRVAERSAAVFLNQGSATGSFGAERGITRARRAMASVDPGLLDRIRERLVSRLPAIPALQSIRLWPWWPWYPWWDCSPDIVFRATQTCGGRENVIVNEGWFSVRQDIPQVLDVTLTTTGEACCIPHNDCIGGECLALAKVCDVDTDEVGGNPGADPSPIGYAYPNVISNGGDAPFAGVVQIRGTAHCLSGVDYYEIEFTADAGVTWQLVPVGALGTFLREYWDFSLAQDVNVAFSATVPVGGRNVYETIEHYEATHTPADWGSTKVWLGTNIDLVFPWVTSPIFGDGTFSLRVVGYNEAGGVLSNPRVLPVCETQTPAEITVTLDNQSTYPAPGPLDNPCGPGTIHICTNEPMTDILDARILHAQGVTEIIGPCGSVTIGAGDMLEIDFIAYDGQGHLAWYSLEATYGENLSRNLIALGGTLMPLPGGSISAPAALQVGPDYIAARTLPQTAGAPIWTGGAIRLSILATIAFPESCCYQLELKAYKRTIVNCNANYEHRNLSERSFQVTV